MLFRGRYPVTGLQAELYSSCKISRWHPGIRRNKMRKITENRLLGFPANIFFLNFLGWWYLVRRPLIGLFYQLRMIYNECGAVGGMRIGRGNRSTRRKPSPVLSCTPKIPHDLTCARNRAAAVGNRRLITWAMAGSHILFNRICSYFKDDFEFNMLDLRDTERRSVYRSLVAEPRRENPLQHKS
jgi:hypothetical protein